MFEKINQKFKTKLVQITDTNGFLNHSLKLSGGTVIAQAIPILFSPLLARLYTPEQFGLFAVISSITAIMSVVFTGKYEMAIVLCDTSDDIVNLIGVGFSLALSFMTLSLVLLFFCSELITSHFEHIALMPWIFLCPITAVCISIYQFYNEWCIKNKQFGKLSSNKMTNSGSITISNVSFGVLNESRSGLILGDFIGRFITSIVCLLNISRNEHDLIRRLSFNKMKLLALKNIDFPKYILTGQLLNMLGGQLPILMLAYFFSKEEIGYYSMASMVLTIPVSVISLAIRDVFKQRAYEQFKKTNSCITVYKEIAKPLIIISFSIFLILYIFLPDIFSLVFGQQWRTAGYYARIFCPMVMINFLSESFTGMYYIANKMNKLLLWQIIYLITNFTFLVLAYYMFGNIIMVLVGLVVGRIIADLISIKMTYSFAKGN